MKTHAGSFYMSLINLHVSLSSTLKACDTNQKTLMPVIVFTKSFALSVLFHILPGVGHVGWEATIVDLSNFFNFIFSLFKHRQIIFSLAFSFVSYSSRCGFLFFLSFVRVTWDGRPQLLTYLFSFFFFLFSSLFKHSQIVLLQGNRVL